jgi:regulator of protease activity HflC (stomatin/prohibitin superfamily)
MTDTKVLKVFQRGFVFRFSRIVLLVLLVVSLVYGIIAAIYATKTIFKVKMNYAVVLEKLGGDRQAVTEIGWHARLPFFTRIEQEVTLMNQTMHLGGTQEPMRIISKENVPCGLLAC